MVCQVVFNLYPFSDNYYLPSANIVQTDAGGTLTHLVQKATPATVGAYGIAITPLLGRLFGIIDALSPKSLEAKFKPPKARTATPLPQLLNQPETRPSVERYLYREMDAFLSEIIQNRLPLTLDSERKTLAKDVQISFATDTLIPHLSFRKTTAGIEYRFQLGTEREKWSIHEQNVIPLTNTDPAWLLVGYVLFRVPGINGNMVRPFRNKEAIQIPPDKTRAYFQTFIARTARRAHIEAEGFQVFETNTLLHTRLELVENIMARQWLLKPVFVYDGTEFSAGDQRDRITSVDFPDDKAEVAVHRISRDQTAEKERLAFLASLSLLQDGNFYKIPGTTENEDARVVLQNNIEWLCKHKNNLESNGFTLAAPETEGKRLLLAVPAIQIETGVEPDWFDVRGEIQAGEFRIPFASLVPWLKKGDRFYALPDNTYFLIPDTWFTRFADLARSVEPDGDDKLRLRKSLFTVLEAAGISEDAGAAFPLIQPETVDYHPPAELNATLRPYQLLGVKWLIGHYRQGFGACLADDMGLGKTLQTIALLLYAKKEKKELARENAGAAPQLNLFNAYEEALRPLNALVILPSSLIFNWLNELTRFAPSLFVYVHTGPKRLKDIRAIAGHDIVLTTYHTARQDLEIIGKINWHAIVLDESQQIKNRTSEVSKVVRELAADCKISLSGTPIENSLSDLWTQMEFINPDTLGSYPYFKETFQIPIEKQQDEKARDQLFNRVRPFFLRRTKEEVAPDLPELSQQVFFSEMAPAQRKQYEQIKSAVRNQILSLFDDPKTRLQALQALTRLRQIANHPLLTEPDYIDGSGKFEDVMAQWEVVQKSGHKVLFFSSFEKHLQIFRAAFEKSGHPYAWLTGDTPGPDRAAQVRKFQDDRQVQVFFMTLKAGGVGLNLTAADYVFLLDPWWNPAAEDQAIARAHRIGRTRPVTALRFISKDSIEEKILQLQDRKRALGKGLFESGNEMPHLDREDMESLLS